MSKLCKDCKHSYRANWLWALLEGKDKEWWCYGPQRPKSLASGLTQPGLCEAEREDYPRLIDRKVCGSKAEYFEPKPESKLPYWDFPI